jgi:hypothetical protein
MNPHERKRAQEQFRTQAQVCVATEAAVDPRQSSMALQSRAGMLSGVAATDRTGTALESQATPQAAADHLKGSYQIEVRQRCQQERQSASGTSGILNEPSPALRTVSPSPLTVMKDRAGERHRSLHSPVIRNQVAGGATGVVTEAQVSRASSASKASRRVGRQDFRLRIARRFLVRSTCARQWDMIIPRQAVPNEKSSCCSSRLWIRVSSA